MPDAMRTSTPQEVAGARLGAPQPETVPEDPRPANGPQTGTQGFRPTASQITDDQLDRLYAELAEMTTVAKLNHGLHTAAHDEAEQMRAERDQARRWAVALENQLAAVRALHVDSLTTWGVVRGTPGDPDRPYCVHCGQPWRCDTIRALDDAEGGERP